MWGCLKIDESRAVVKGHCKERVLTTGDGLNLFKVLKSILYPLKRLGHHTQDTIQARYLFDPDATQLSKAKARRNVT